ncbi:MAG: pilus assembly protein N-terminal domain-containing protein, partial [Oscillospiraceae bacterium]|nr:pilus assembly protein N-terminal domain-containing protein [Oscillospiraceae bacterium]
TADLRNVPLQGKFNIKITIEDILGLALPALDCELIRLDTNEVVASWNTGTEPNKVVENLDYSFKRLDVTLKGDIIYALRIKNMPDHMVFYDTKMPNPIRIAGISILEFANGTNIYGNVRLCDPNYTEPAHTEVTTGIPTAADMTATTNNTTYTTVTSTVMTHITTLPTTGTKLRFSLGQYEGQELKGDTVSLTVSAFSDRSIPVFGVRKGVTVQYALADPTIAEIVGSESQSVTLRARKAGNTTLTAKSSDGQTATIKVAVDTLDPNATDCSDAFMTFGILGDSIVINEGNTFGVPAAGFYEDLVKKNGLQFTVEDESVAEVVKGDRQYFILRGLKAGKTKVTVAAGKGNEQCCYVEVLPAIGTTTATTDIILPPRNTNVTSTCVSENTQPVWDEEGHYRGTNALWNAYLETATEPKAVIQMSEDGSTVKSVDLSKIQVNMIEERRFNINVHNVTGMLKVLDYGYVQGTGPATHFFVTLGTDYKDGKFEGSEIKPLTLEFKLPDATGNGEITAVTRLYEGLAHPDEETAINTRGNVNCKETTDVSDAVLLARFVAEDSSADISAQGKKNADVNGDGTIDEKDVIGILRMIAKLPVE